MLVGLSTNVTTGKLDPKFPYFIGDTYRSKVSSVTLDQTFNFNESNLIRNTFPYRTGKEYSGNDFLFESNSPINQITKVESVSKGSVDSFVILNPGENYKVGNSLVFDTSRTGGGGSAAEVSRILGKPITTLSTQYLNYENSVVTKENSDSIKIYTNAIHELSDGDTVQVSGLSTFINNLTGSHIIGISSNYSRLTDTV